MSNLPPLPPLPPETPSFGAPIPPLPSVPKPPMLTVPQAPAREAGYDVENVNSDIPQDSPEEPKKGFFARLFGL